MGRHSSLRPEEQCEYRRCGGKGGREVARPRRACTSMVVNARAMRVCESCADLLRRSGGGRSGASGGQLSGPSRLGDIVPAMSPPLESATVAPDGLRARRKRGGRPRSTRSRRQVQPSGEKHADARPTSPPAHPSRRDDARPEAARAPLAESRVDESVVAAEPGVRHIRRRPGGSTIGAHPVARAKQTAVPLRKPADELASPEQRLHQLLTSRGCKFVDSRPKGGVLWIIGGSEHAPTIREARALGYTFTWSAAGGKKTRGRAGWWCKRMRA